MKINGKDYEITTKNIKVGLMKRYRRGELEEDELDNFIQKILEPSPTVEEIDEFSYDSLLEVYGRFGQKIKEKQAEIRKKFSQ